MHVYSFQAWFQKISFGGRGGGGGRSSSKAVLSAPVIILLDRGGPYQSALKNYTLLTYKRDDGPALNYLRFFRGKGVCLPVFLKKTYSFVIFEGVWGLDPYF